MKYSLFYISLFLSLFCSANTYYISAGGNDDANGKSIKSAWKSLNRINNFSFSPGDSLLLEGGSVFRGNIHQTGGAGKNLPMLISSYGTGKATINGGTSTGIYLLNTGNIVIKNIIVTGGGYNKTSMKIHGIEFRTVSSVKQQIQNIIIDSVEVTGFGGNGIYFNAEDTLFGFSNVRITNCRLHSNGIAGLFVTGSWNNEQNLIRYNNNNIYVGNSVAFNNHGRSNFKDNWSGSGILVAGTINGTIEYCEAFENGAENGSNTAGPVGIWTDDSKYVTIQYCTSHHNKGGKGKKDGGGFDIDGGSYGCVVQYCNSYENEGAGYGLFQWETGNRWSNDTVRNNNSTNDGRNALYGSITCWGAGAAYRVENAEVYGNTIRMNKPGKALGFIGNNFTNIRIYDNEFCLQDSATYAPVIPTNVIVTGSVFKCKQDTVISLPDTVMVQPDSVIVNDNDDQDISMFPNPVQNGVLNVKISSMEFGNYSIRLINISGIIVYSRLFTSHDRDLTFQLNVREKPPGAYVLQVINGEHQSRKLLIIQ